MNNIKNYSLTKEQEFKLFMQLDNYSLVDNCTLDISLNELMSNYKEEYLKDSDYNTYYEFLTDKLEELFYNSLEE